MSKRRGSGSRSAGRAGAAVAIAVNGVLLYVAENLLQWGVLPFLTDDYNLVLPAIRLTLVATMGANGLRLIFPTRWMSIATDMVSTGFGLSATIRLFQVFPFEFNGADSRWDVLARALLIVAIGGSLIGLLVAPLRLISSISDR